MSIYSNGLLIHMNEIAFLEFTETMQTSNGPVARIAVQYDFLRQMYMIIGEAIAQHDSRLAEVSKARSAMN